MFLLQVFRKLRSLGGVLLPPFFPQARTGRASTHVPSRHRRLGSGRASCLSRCHSSCRPGPPTPSTRTRTSVVCLFPYKVSKLLPVKSLLPLASAAPWAEDGARSAVAAARLNKAATRSCVHPSDRLLIWLLRAAWSSSPSPASSHRPVPKMEPH
jgi:hypothetical protein